MRKLHWLTVAATGIRGLYRASCGGLVEADAVSWGSAQAVTCPECRAVAMAELEELRRKGLAT